VGTKKSVSLPVAIAVGGSSNGGAGDTTAPYVPDNLEVLPISATQMNLTWSASEGDSDFTGYKIYRDGVRIGYSVTTSYVDVFSFVPGKTYKYTVAAFDTEDNTSEPSVAVSGVAPAPINPNPEPNPNPTPTPGPTCPAAQTGGSTSGGAGTATFWGDFESGSVTGSGNHNWDHLQVDGDGSLKVVSGGARQGSNYGHIVLADSGCSSCVERAEVVQMHNSSGGIQDENENSGTVRYSFSVRFDTSWRSMVGDNNGAWGIFLQLHGADSLGTNPAFAFDASDVIRFSLRGGNLSQNNGDDYDLSNNSLNKGKWIDFIMTIKYAKDTTGFVTIERRDEGQTNYTTVLNIPNVATLQYANGQGVLPHYMKHGLYRNHENFTSILDVDGFTREVVTGSAPAPSDTQAPSASTGLTATAASSNLVNLSWTAPTDNVGVNCYQIYRGGVQIGTSAGTSYTDTSASGSTTYSYTVVAYDAAGNRGDESAAASVTTPRTHSRRKRHSLYRPHAFLRRTRTRTNLSRYCHSTRTQRIGRHGCNQYRYCFSTGRRNGTRPSRNISDQRSHLCQDR
jgi:chitodextrinase